MSDTIHKDMVWKCSRAPPFAGNSYLGSYSTNIPNLSSYTVSFIILEAVMYFSCNDPS